MMTVSRVINGGVGVRPETRRRVERAVAELDFVPNGVARGLMTRKSGTLGLIVPDIVNPFFTMVVHGAETVARRAGYRLLLCNSEADLGQERQYVEHMISHRVEGLLIAPLGDRSKANLALLERRKVPFVLIDRSGSRLEVRRGARRQRRWCPPARGSPAIAGSQAGGRDHRAGRRFRQRVSVCKAGREAVAGRRLA